MFPLIIYFLWVKAGKFFICSFSVSVLLYIKCLCSCLLGPPATQGAPLLECHCCHCHTCTTHRPSFLPLHSVSPGVQVLLFSFPFLNLWSPHICLHANLAPPSPLHLIAFTVVGVPQCTFLLYYFIILFLYFPPLPFSFLSLIYRLIQSMYWKGFSGMWRLVQKVEIVSAGWCLVVSF